MMAARMRPVGSKAARKGEVFVIAKLLSESEVREMREAKAGKRRYQNSGTQHACAQPLGSAGHKKAKSVEGLGLGMVHIGDLDDGIPL